MSAPARSVSVQNMIDSFRQHIERMEAEAFAGAATVIIWPDGSFSYNAHASAPAARLATIEALRMQADLMEAEFRSEMVALTVARIQAQAEAQALAAQGVKTN